MTFFDPAKRIIHLTHRGAVKAIHSLNKKLSPKDPTKPNLFLVHEIYETARSMPAVDLTDVEEQMLIYYLYYLMRDVFRQSVWTRGRQIIQPVFLEEDRFAFWVGKSYAKFVDWYRKYKRDTTNLKKSIDYVNNKLFDLLKLGIVVDPHKTRVEDEEEDEGKPEFVQDVMDDGGDALPQIREEEEEEDEPSKRRRKHFRWRDEEGKGELAEIREFNVVLPQGELDTIFPASRLRSSDITLVSQRRDKELKKRKRELASTVDPRVLRKEYTPLELMIELTRRKESIRRGKRALTEGVERRKRKTDEIIGKLKKDRKNVTDVLQEVKEFRASYQKVVHMRKEQQQVLSEGREEREHEIYNLTSRTSIVDTSNQIHIELLMTFDKWVDDCFTEQPVSVFDIYRDLKQFPRYHDNELFFKTLIEFLYPIPDMWRIWQEGYTLGNISEGRYHPGNYRKLNDFIILWEAMEETSVVHGSSANRKILLGLDNFVLKFFPRGDFNIERGIKVETLKSQINKYKPYETYHYMIDKYIAHNTVEKGLQGDEYYKPLNYKKMNEFLSGWRFKSEPGIDDEVQKLLDEMGRRIEEQEEEKELGIDDEGGDELEYFEEQLSREVLEQTTFRYGTKSQRRILREYNYWMEIQFETVSDVFLKDVLHAVEVRKRDSLERRDARDAWIFEDLQKWIRRKILIPIKGENDEDIARKRNERKNTMTVRELFYLLDTMEDDEEERDMYIDTVREWAQKYFILRNKVDIRILRGSTERNYEKYEENKEFLDGFFKYLEDSGKRLYMYNDFEVMNQFLRGRGEVITKMNEIREQRQQAREVEERRMDGFDRDLKLKADEKLEEIREWVRVKPGSQKPGSGSQKAGSGSQKAGSGM